VFSSQQSFYHTPAEPLLDALLAAFSERIQGPASACTRTMVILDRILTEPDIPKMRLLMERSRSIRVNLVFCLSEMASPLGQAVLENTPTVIAFRHTETKETKLWKSLLGNNDTPPFRWPWQPVENRDRRSLHAGEAFFLQRTKKPAQPLRFILA